MAQSDRPTDAHPERGHLEAYLDHEAVTAALRAMAERHPTLTRLRSLGTTPEGRDLWCLTLGRDPDRDRPALFVNANQHAAELAGSNVALAIADAVLRVLSDPDASIDGVPDGALAAIRDGLVHVVPRVSPDGAERVLKEGIVVRSVPRDARPTRNAPRWVSQDLDGDGRSLLIRREDPAGDYVVSAAVPGLLVPREIGDPGPYYRVWPEGIIEGWDGVHVPSPVYLSDNYPDLNRNFPYDWTPESDQAGAGPYPGSEVESRALVTFATEHPSLWGWIDLHTFGGVYIRPLGTGPDTKMDQQDLAVYKRIARWAEEQTGYPMVSGYEEFVYEPDKPLRGDLTEYAYHQRGCLAFVVELWDVMEQAGLPRQKRFVDRYAFVDREELEQIARWATTRFGPDAAGAPWTALDHPQLGPVEVGGFDPRFVLWNPPPSELPALCRGQVAVALRMLAMAPRLELADIACEAVGPGLRRIALTVRNLGYLPTTVVAPGRTVAHHEPIIAELTGADGGSVDVVSGSARCEVGALDGWGRGRHGPSASLFTGHSPGDVASRRVTWVVRGDGPVDVRVGSARTGWLSARIG